MFIQHKSGTTHYAYGRNGALTYEKNLTTGVIREYAYLNNQIIGWKETDKNGNSVKRYAATDLLGSVTTVTDHISLIKAITQYDYNTICIRSLVHDAAYKSILLTNTYLKRRKEVRGHRGEETTRRKSWFLSPNYDGMYIGKDIDSETGLTYHWNRWRSEDGSSFISEDPARDGSNWYGYCGNNPISFQDPTGLSTIRDDYAYQLRMQGRTGEANDMEKEAADDNNGRTEPVDPTIEQLKRIEAWLDQIINFSTGQQYRLDQSKDAQLNNLAGAITQNLGYLDPDTAAYIIKLPEQYRQAAIQSILGDQTVVTGVDPVTADLAATAMGMVLGVSGGQAFSVGGYIFVFDTTADPYTLGHEGIHGIQSIAAGGTINFLNNYNSACMTAGSTKTPRANATFIEINGKKISMEDAYYGNEIEKAAYSFGPKNSDADTNLPGGKGYVQYMR